MQFENFKEHSVAEFFKKNRHMLGFSGKIRSLTMIIHEYVTNSLDACEEAGILPNIKVEIKDLGDYYKVVVQDNGPGLPKHLIGKALGQMLAGTKFHRYVQQRGQQGIGAAGCTMYSLLTTGKPVHVLSAHNGVAVSCDVSIDFKTNKPILKNIEEREANFHGLTVEAYFGDVKFDRGQYGVLEYLKRTALVNPHAHIELRVNNEVFRWERSSNKIPKKPKEIKPHPLGVEPHDLWELAKTTHYRKISTFLVNEMIRISHTRVKEIEKLSGIDFEKDPKSLTWEEVKKIVSTMRNMKWSSPPLDAVVPIGKEVLEISLKNILNPEYIYVIERSPKVYRGGIPYLVEVAIAYGKTTEDFKGQIMRFANKVPLLFDNSACIITKAVKDVEWRRYGIQNFDEEPIAVLVNISSVHVPYVSAGKQAVAEIEEIEREIKNAVMEAARGIKMFLSRKHRVMQKERKKKLLLRYVDRLSEDMSYLSGEDKEEIKQLLQKIIEEKTA